MLNIYFSIYGVVTESKCLSNVGTGCMETPPNILGFIGGRVLLD